MRYFLAMCYSIVSISSLYLLFKIILVRGFIFSHLVAGLTASPGLVLFFHNPATSLNVFCLNFVVWSIWVFFTSVMENSLSLRILSALVNVKINDSLRTELSGEFNRRVQNLVENKVVVYDPETKLFNVNYNSRWVKIDGVLVRLFNVKSKGLY